MSGRVLRALHAFRNDRYATMLIHTRTLSVACLGMGIERRGNVWVIGGAA